MMKLTTFIMVQLLATAAMACPNLAGTYRCTFELEDNYKLTSKLKIQQSGDLFTFNSEIEGENLVSVWIADGITRLNQDSSSDQVDVYSKYSCEGNTLVSEDRQVVKDPSSIAAPVDSKSVTQLEGNKLVVKYTDTTRFDDGSTEVEKSSVVCDRM